MKSNETETAGDWRTAGENLIQYVPSGVFYARIRVNGKLHRKSLKTPVKTVAKLRLNDLEKELRERAASVSAHQMGKMRFRDATEIYKKRLTARTDIKERTKSYYQEALAALLKSWNALAELDCNKISEHACQEWAARYSSQVSPTRFNNTLAILREILDIARKAGARYGNPAADVSRKTVRAKHLVLPTTPQFIQFVTTIENAGGRFSKACADFVRFLAFTGCRKSEAANVRWADVNFDKQELIIRGDPKSGTKNHEIRRVYMISGLSALLKRMRSEDEDARSTDVVLKVNEAQKAMDRAAKIVGIKRITHHDLRHLFATILIEQGIDIPTIARLLGHKDGGALAMRIYGHLRDDHARASVAKVQFSA